jgi:hypothetical protein
MEGGRKKEGKEEGVVSEKLNISSLQGVSPG